ncbi:YaaL family protein [Aquibacillus sediminis]|uniref:YaaL family protein n=1 Tax=Aquibacillus sediminis TaxID=2574734 RepID=UPI001108EE94|nr:YaaL family protein [Aquibacillus sediminis]
MSVRKKMKKRDMDKQLLEDINRFKREWLNISSILERSIDSSEKGQFELSVAEAKYLYLLREARHRKVNALQ